jgi:hypothetical protein
MSELRSLRYSGRINGSGSANRGHFDVANSDRLSDRSAAHTDCEAYLKDRLCRLGTAA